MNYEEMTEYDLLTKLSVVKTEFGGRSSAVFDGYRGQFFWHINDVNCSDWDATYIFENGSVGPGGESMCKVILSENIKKSSGGNFPLNRQFCIREGLKVIATGVILENNLSVS